MMIYHDGQLFKIDDYRYSDYNLYFLLSIKLNKFYYFILKKKRKNFFLEMMVIIYLILI